MTTADHSFDDRLHDEQLDAALATAEAEWADELGGSLAELLAPPEGLAQRTTLGVRDALLVRSALATGLDLLGLGWHTLRYLGGAAETEVTRP